MRVRRRIRVLEPEWASFQQGDGQTPWTETGAQTGAWTNSYVQRNTSDRIQDLHTNPEQHTETWCSVRCGANLLNIVVSDRTVQAIVSPEDPKEGEHSCTSPSKAEVCSRVSPICSEFGLMAWTWTAHKCSSPDRDSRWIPEDHAASWD
jgi:hypothetical protein